MDLINAIGQDGEWGYALDWADSIKPDGCWWHDLFLVQILRTRWAFRGMPFKQLPIIVKLLLGRRYEVLYLSPRIL
jgi:hypothetical protein